jgi:FkbM family methyltransferase
MFARPGTSDVPNFEDIFVWAEYDLPLSIVPRFIVDAGAYVGYASLSLANQYPNAKVVAIEPEASNFDVLSCNIRPYEQIRAVNAALWSHQTKVRIRNPTDRHWALQVAPAAAGDGTIDSITIPDVLAMAGEETIDILKLDIEGAEKELFADGCQEWMGKVRVIIIELHDRLVKGCSRTFYAATSQQHFTQFHQGENVILERYEQE